MAIIVLEIIIERITKGNMQQPNTHQMRETHNYQSNDVF